MGSVIICAVERAIEVSITLPKVSLYVGSYCRWPGVFVLDIWRAGGVVPARDQPPYVSAADWISKNKDRPDAVRRRRRRFR